MKSHSNCQSDKGERTKCGGGEGRRAVNEVEVVNVRVVSSDGEAPPIGRRIKAGPDLELRWAYILPQRSVFKKPVAVVCLV